MHQGGPRKSAIGGAQRYGLNLLGHDVNYCIRGSTDKRGNKLSLLDTCDVAARHPSPCATLTNASPSTYAHPHLASIPARALRRPQVYLDHLNDAGMLEAALPKRGDKYAGHLSACSAESFLRLKPILKLSEKPWLADQLSLV